MKKEPVKRYSEALFPVALFFYEMEIRCLLNELFVMSIINMDLQDI